MRIKQTRRLSQRSNQSRNDIGTRPTNSRADWQSKYDHYLARGRLSSDAGDRVEAESNYQHADHYFRLLQGAAV